MPIKTQLFFTCDRLQTETCKVNTEDNSLLYATTILVSIAASKNLRIESTVKVSLLRKPVFRGLEQAVTFQGAKICSEYLVILLELSLSVFFFPLRFKRYFVLIG